MLRRVTRLRDVRLSVIVTPNTVKIDADDDDLDCPQVEYSGTDCCPVCPAESDRKRRPERRQHHSCSFRTRLASALAGGHRLCFPVFSLYRWRRVLSRICPLPGWPNHSRTSIGRNYFHTHVCLVRRDLVLEGVEERLSRRNLDLAWESGFR